MTPTRFPASSDSRQQNNPYADRRLGTRPAWRGCVMIATGDFAFPS